MPQGLDLAVAQSIEKGIALGRELVSAGRRQALVHWQGVAQALRTVPGFMRRRRAVLGRLYGGSTVKIQFNAPPASAEVSNGIPVKYDNVKRKGAALALVSGAGHCAADTLVLCLQNREQYGAARFARHGGHRPGRGACTDHGQVEQVARRQATEQGARACVWCKSRCPRRRPVMVQAADVVAGSADHTYAMQRQDLQGQQKALQSSLQAMRGRMSLMGSRAAD